MSAIITSTFRLHNGQDVVLFIHAIMHFLQKVCLQQSKTAWF